MADKNKVYIGGYFSADWAARFRLLSEHLDAQAEAVDITNGAVFAKGVALIPEFKTISDLKNQGKSDDEVRKHLAELRRNA